jgi:hypothetical protein
MSSPSTRRYTRLFGTRSSSNRPSAPVVVPSSRSWLVLKICPFSRAWKASHIGKIRAPATGLPACDRTRPATFSYSSSVGRRISASSVPAANGPASAIRSVSPSIARRR